MTNGFIGGSGSFRGGKLPPEKYALRQPSDPHAELGGSGRRQAEAWELEEERLRAQIMLGGKDGQIAAKKLAKIQEIRRGLREGSRE